MEEPQKIQLSTKDIILRYGLVAGGFSILTIATLYLVDASLLFGFYASIGTVGMLTIGVLAAVKKKATNDGLIPYGDCVGISIGTFSIGAVVYTLFSFLLYFVIDPSLVSKMKNAQIEQTEKFMKSGFIKPEAYKEAVARIEQFNGTKLVYSYSTGLIILIIIALIIFLITSIFVKKDSPFKNSPV